MKQEEINAKAKEYRKYRESCGVIDPVVLDEIEDAYYNGCILAKNVIIKKACELLKDNVDHYAYNKDFVTKEDFIKHFCKAMEE